MKKNIMLMIIGLIIMGSVYAQKHHPKNPELKKEMQSYVEKNIVPVLQKKQAEFDNKLNAEDRVFIRTERIEAKAKRERHRTERKAHREEFEKQNPELVEKRKAKKEEWKNMSQEERMALRKKKKEAFGKHRKPHNPEHHAERKAKKEEIKAFMTRNEDLVQATMEDLKPLYEKWTADQLEIIKKYHPEKAEHLAKKEGHLPTGLFGLNPKGRHGKTHKRGKEHRMQKGKKDANHEKSERSDRGRKGKKGMRKRHRLPVEFVLWDGSTPQEAQPRTNESNTSNNIKTNEIALGQNYPNPAKSITRIELDLPTQMANLDLTITDLQGKIVKRMNLSDLNAGSETIELNVSDLPNGQYFYSIEGKGIKTTKKMTVNH